MLSALRSPLKLSRPEFYWKQKRLQQPTLENFSSFFLKIVNGNFGPWHVTSSGRPSKSIYVLENVKLQQSKSGQKAMSWASDSFISFASSSCFGGFSARFVDEVWKHEELFFCVENRWTVIGAVPYLCCLSGSITWQCIHLEFCSLLVLALTCWSMEADVHSGLKSGGSSKLMDHLIFLICPFLIILMGKLSTSTQNVYNSKGFPRLPGPQTYYHDFRGHQFLPQDFKDHHIFSMISRIIID